MCGEEAACCQRRTADQAGGCGWGAGAGEGTAAGGEVLGCILGPKRPWV